MREEKWGIVERFRVRQQWRGRIESHHPKLLGPQMRARAALTERGAHVLGPFLMSWPDGEWLTVAWQLPDRQLGEQLRELARDPEWRECVEHELLEGWKFDPLASLPGFD